MWRASLLALALAAVPARADDLAAQLGEQVTSIDRALETVGEKLGGVDVARTKRLGAAYRALATPATDEAARLALARKRAAARLVIERDLSEHRLLADEAAQLRTAAEHKRAELARLPEIRLPTELGRPARGAIVRHFGTVEHERSKTLLSRRGIDLDVESKGPAVAAEAGVVRYAGPIRGLESGVIVDHGTYLTVTAKLGELAVAVGASVQRGDRLGRAARYRVYFEVRVEVGPGGLPIDPEPLLAGSR